MAEQKTFQALNMDRSQRLVIDTAGMDWLSSPAKGVERKPLEREAAETGQVTSVVRYAAGSAFPAHNHPAGEEILVLSGVFEDEHGRYPAGSYFRNPPGSCHTPASREGCELLVKLNMFQPDDLQSVNVNTQSADWLPGPVDGLSVMPLHNFGTEQTILLRWQPGACFFINQHTGGAEIYVLDGILHDQHGSYPAGSWLRLPCHSQSQYSQSQSCSEQGCTIWLKTGHLGFLTEKCSRG